MLPDETIAEIRRLLAEGNLSHRKIARRMGVSRGTVHTVAVGRPRRIAPPRDERQPVDRHSGPPKRCPECGGLVYLPCQLCKARRIRDDAPAGASDAPVDAADVDLDLQLTGRQRKRYEKLRARRMAAEPDRRRNGEPEPSCEPHNLGPETLRDAFDAEDALDTAGEWD